MNTREQTRKIPSKFTLALAAIALPAIMLASSATAHSPASGNEQHDRNGKRSIDLAELEARAKERFSTIDSNADSRISPEEFASAKRPASPDGFRRLRGHKQRWAQQAKRHHRDPANLTAEQQTQLQQRQAALFSRLDTDASGQLSAEEFAQAREIRRAFKHENRRAQRFDRLDTNSDNWLSEDELLERLTRLRALDSNADGYVDRSELRAGRAERRAQQRG